MQFIFNLFLFFLIPILVDSIISRGDDPILCVTETNNGCKTQLEKKNSLLNNIPSNFPPLSSVLKNYTEQCQNVMKCASGLECFKGKSERDVFKTSCDDVGSRRYTFDYKCMAPFLRKLFDGGQNCTGDIIVGNLSTQIFKTQKQCFLNIAKSVCDTENFDFFQKNYDEVMELYTTRPAVDDEFCASPNDKFNKMQCEYLTGEFSQKTTTIPFLSITNRSNSEGQELFEMIKQTQNCLDNSCLDLSINVENNTRIFTDTFQASPTNLTKIFKLRPRLLEYSCLANITIYTFFREVSLCTMFYKKEDCVMSTIIKFCQEEILADFKNLEVSVGPRKEVYNSPDFEFAMFRDNKKKRRFVFTMKDDKLIE
ncbi:hypothetical protein CRE_19756 [Caenorhabditis remanei]|uniref:T20D4.11-like domain-containing protein n=1 Tax=Caenorhabditis remanei TaxID=31234 RepID=E3MTN0_CAERE|nr:hypothetical protein CRE_19756 [Caenorhabditis remanei]